MSDEGSRGSVSYREKAGIYSLLLLILVGLAVGLWSGLSESIENYQRGIQFAESMLDEVESAESPAYRPDVSLLYILQYSRAMTADANKSAALYLGFVVVLVGCLFVLYGAEAFYSLKMQQKEVKSALETSSPGLVLITFGILVITVALLTKAEFTTDVSWQVFPSAGPQKVLAPGAQAEIERLLEEMRAREDRLGSWEGLP